MKLWARCLWAVALAIIPSATASGSLNKLAAMGDSLSDEYWDSGVSTYATNWTELVARYRGIDMGPTAAEAGTGSWGEPRNAGFKYNWARSGATTATLLTQGQPTGLLSQVGSEGVSNAVLAIGPNDFNPSSSAFLGIYYGFWSAAQIQSYVNQSINNIETALATVRTAGVSVVVANVIDPGATPAVANVFPNATYRDRVTAAVQSVNSGVKYLAQKHQVPLMDWFGLEKAMLGPNSNLRSTLLVGNVAINLRASDSGPPLSMPANAFVSDGFHPNTVLQGIFANLILQAFNSGYGAGIALFSEQEILNHALLAYGGSDTLQSQLGPYTGYVILPTLPRFTAVNPAGTNLVLTFSTVPNQLYLLESRDDLDVGSWTTLTSNIAGTGSLVTLTNQVSANLPKRFYRVRQLP